MRLEALSGPLSARAGRTPTTDPAAPTDVPALDPPGGFRAELVDGGKEVDIPDEDLKTEYDHSQGLDSQHYGKTEQPCA